MKFVLEYIKAWATFLIMLGYALILDLSDWLNKKKRNDFMGV
jgi:hypothetical protein